MRAHHLLLSSPPTHAPQAAKKPGRALTRAATGTVIGAALGLVLLPGGGPRTPALLAAEPPLITTTASAVPPSTGSRAWGLRQTPVVDVVRRVKDAVVNIHSERTVRANPADELFSLSPSQSRVSGMGTGIVIDPRGYIVTNQHVVEDVSLIRVRLSDGTTATARILSRDAQEDLALLKINPPRPLPVMPMGTASDLMVGETVVAIGNAYGYDHTVTVGVVSAVGRDVNLNKEVRYKSLIQTDASINPGNSGGPLLNVHGELVGVNVAIRAGAQGIGFAIPVDTLIRVGAVMLARANPSSLTPGDLGLNLQDQVVPAGGPDARQLERQAVAATPSDGTPAARAGLRTGDVLCKVGDLPVSSTLDVQRGLLSLPTGREGRSAGERLSVVVRRDGAERKLELNLEAARTAQAAHADRPGVEAPVGAEVVWRKLGLRLHGTSPGLALPSPLRGGLAIAEVRPDSPAARAGFRPGDVLVGLHQWEMLTLDNVLYVVNHPDRDTFRPLRFYILRAGQVHRGALQLAD